MINSFTYPENPIEYKKFNKIAELTAKINLINRMLEMYETADSVLNKFDGKVINKKISDAVTAAFENKWPKVLDKHCTQRVYHSSIASDPYAWNEVKKEMSFWATDVELERITTYDGTLDWNIVSFRDLYNNKFHLVVSDEVITSERLDYKKTKEEMNKNITNLINKRNCYQDAIDNYDKYHKMNHDMEAYVKEYKQNINRELAIDKVYTLYI